VEQLRVDIAAGQYRNHHLTPDVEFAGQH
jgi:hypothetical protein